MQGIRASGHQEKPPRGIDGAMVQRCRGAEVRGAEVRGERCRGAGHQGIRASGHQGIRKSRRGAAEVRGER